MNDVLFFEVEESLHKLRLEDFLFRKFPTLSKMYLREIITDGKCTVGGMAKDRGFKLRTGNKIEIEVDLSAQTSMMPENIPLDIIFEDNEIIVVNKAAGMLVHPTKGVRNGTLLNALTYHLNYKHERDSEEFIRAGLVHRLDRKTSGLIVIAKNLRALRIIADHFTRRIVDKRYFALVEGIVEEDSGTINAPIGKDEEKRVWHITEDGKSAESIFQVIERKENSTLLEMKPVTGRTNQLRLHCLHIGHPIIGDDLYGGQAFPRLCLHAYKLSFWHPNGGERLEFETKLPTDFVA
jgi:23S rRNA pseudouridine1911/1915/1917 synthase